MPPLQKAEKRFPATLFNRITKLKFILCIVFSYLLSITSFGQSGTSINEMIVGNWKYNISYDTIGVVASAETVETSQTFPMFISQLKIQKEEATLFDGTTKVKCTWEISNNNQITFHFNNGKSRTYQITSLTSNSLELKELAEQGSTLGYKKK